MYQHIIIVLLVIKNSYKNILVMKKLKINNKCFKLFNKLQMLPYKDLINLI